MPRKEKIATKKHTCFYWGKPLFCLNRLFGNKNFPELKNLPGEKGPCKISTPTYSCKKLLKSCLFGVKHHRESFYFIFHPNLTVRMLHRPDPKYCWQNKANQ
jgi:hypothetical protein